MGGTYKGVIFDLDGTLADTLADLAASGNFVLEKFGFAPVPEDGYRYHVGNGLRTMISRALETSLAQQPVNAEADDALLDRMHTAVVEHYDANWNVKSGPYSGITAMLDALEDKNIPVAICSNKIDSFVKEMTSCYFPNLPFVEALGQRQDVPLKPDTTGPLLLAGKMGLQPGEIVFAGDTKVDMLTANRAGMFAVGVSWGFRPVSELLEHGAAVIIHKPDEILKLFA